MREAVARVWRYYHTPLGRKMFRFTAVSLISTAVSFTTLALVYGVLRLGGEVSDTLFANLVATVPAYNLNRRWAWGKTGRSHMTKEVLPFWAMSIAGILLSIFCAAVARHIGIKYDLSHLDRTILVLAANIFSFGVLWILKFLLFNRLFHVSPLGDETELVEA